MRGLSLKRPLLVLAAFVVLALPASATRLPILASHDWWPVWSPDGHELAFTRLNGQGTTFTLMVVDMPSRVVHQVAVSNGQLSPSWSSSDELTFSLGRQIYTSAADGSNRVQLTAVGRSYAPAWRPGSSDIAFLTTRGSTNTDLWVGDTLWAKNAIGKPAWSPDGSELAFQRDDGVYVMSGPMPGPIKRVAAVDNPSPAVWSPDGKHLAFAADDRVWTVPVDGATAPHAVSHRFADISSLSWSGRTDTIAFTRRGAVEVTSMAGKSHPLTPSSGVGLAYSPADDTLAFSGPNPRCPGHDAIRLFLDKTHSSVVAGTCVIRGTAGPDLILGSGKGGDVIQAGAGNDVVRAQNGHVDRVDCGPGRDTVWADAKDVLSSCEVVHLGK